MGCGQGQQAGAGGLPTEQKLLMGCGDSAGSSWVEGLAPSTLVSVHRWHVPHTGSLRMAWGLLHKLICRFTDKRGWESWKQLDSCERVYMCVYMRDVFQTLMNSFSSYFLLILDPFVTFDWLWSEGKKWPYTKEKGELFSCLLGFKSTDLEKTPGFLDE